MEKIQIFLDTDVIISSFIPNHGASFEVVNNLKINKIISKTIENEINEVVNKLQIRKNLKIMSDFKTVSVGLTKDKLLEKYTKYVSDETDSHVVAGANISKSQFLLTFNIKHYKVIKIKNDLGIIVLKPGNFLQYLRSLKN